MALVVFVSCKKDEANTKAPQGVDEEFISAVDISSYPEISNSSPVFYDLDGNPADFLEILRVNGINTVRLRLWVNPSDGHSGFDEVKQFCQTLRTKGFRIWLTLHYSDTWADPGRQETPLQWQGISFGALKDSVHDYTQRVMNEMNPDYIQIGNEVNSGFLHPAGHLTDHLQQFMELMQSGISAVRESSDHSKIIIHFAGIDNADWFFDQVNTLDYDIIGLSYYPIWHGKSLDSLKVRIQGLGQIHDRDVLIAEMAYPFTLGWNDWTNNIVGLDDHLILPDYPATEQGQRDYVKKIKSLTREVEKGIGFCYWGAELIAWKGDQATDASPWENQALFDFQNKALPALTEFKIE